MRTRWSRLEEATAGGEQGAEPVGGGASRGQRLGNQGTGGQTEREAENLQISGRQISAVIKSDIAG